MIQNGQTCLEARSIEERGTEIVRNDYTIDDQYSATHKNAISDGDTKGKGNQSGGHTHYLPDCSKPKSMIDYSNFNTETEAGNTYDINGRNDIGGRKKALSSSIYNKDYQYGLSLINTDQNKGQVRF